MKDGRGKHMIEIKKKNRARVKEWTEKYPGGTATEAMADLNISYNALVGHLKALGIK